jgi:hypothetical protein
VEPADVLVVTGPRADADPSAHGQEVITSRSNTICRNDLGFVVLDRDLDGVPVVPLRLGGTAARAEPLTMVGYGLGGNGRRGKRTGIQLIDIGRSEYYDRASTAPPDTLLLPRSACPGDSGAPVVSDDTGALVGIVSRTLGEDCEQATTYTIATQLAPYADLLSRAFERASAEPVLEGDDATSTRSTSSCALAARSVPSHAGWTALLMAVMIAALGRARGTRRRLAETPLELPASDRTRFLARNLG